MLSRGNSVTQKSSIFTAFQPFELLLCKPLYSLWGNFCYPLSVFFKLRIKLQFYCQKPDKHWTFGHRKSDLKDCSLRSLKDIKIYTLQDNGCCTITFIIFWLFSVGYFLTAFRFARADTPLP